MGLAKRWQEEMDSRGFREAADRNVCDECVDDEALRDHIRSNAEATRCDYCERESEDPIACDLDTFLYAVADGIAVEWRDAEDEMPHEGGGWALPEANRDAWEVVSNLGVEFAPGLYEDVVEPFTDRVFAPRYFFDVSPDEALRFGWDGFVEHVSHGARYLFTTVDPPNDFAHAREIAPSEMLDEIGKVTASLGIVHALTAGELFRARAYPRNAAHPPSTANELGTPPVEHATVSNRMSPIGIPMFYGALDEDTAFDETVAAAPGADHDVTVGVFTAQQPLHVVDLNALPDIPSVFERDRLDVRWSLIFLHHFADEVRKPINRDDREHLEYVPTQIVTEYFRHVCPTDHGIPVDGILYRSAVRDGGTCVVLFIDNGDCVDPEAAADGARQLVLQRINRRRS
jgi:hypothetical protein